ncbi:hypothetical protein [Niabella aurantiaca]|uniref:hypothetical protein n=1 Tax=Niabella aurantiaca TaxID=379900 RepID=UPI00037FD655|nr:hypothetical protein [Niabella aurantiaca]
MKISLTLLILLFTAQSLMAQPGKVHIAVKPVKPVIANHGMVVRTVAHTTHYGRVISGVASSKSNGKKYGKIHYKRKYPVVAKKTTKVRTLR